ncbi:GDSL-type esterase/lipase family protein [Selenomonas sp. AB3002]|uniref:SGNH/GDSL hydrolase family protein n=1 Tax=Selenomonas sp. AB3002 TaxID=1392502 RepID=UPI00049634FD
MKKFLLFAIIILSFTLLSIFVAEKTDVLGLQQKTLVAAFKETDGHLVLSWERLPYPCFYRIETYSKTTGLVANEPDLHFFLGEFTFNDSYEVPRSAIPMYYRVTAYGMFGQLTEPSAPIANPNYAATRPESAPVPIFHYTKEKPASLMPFLVWHTVPDAVCYEVELLSAPPAQEGGIQPDKASQLYITRKVYTNGWQADLRPYANRQVIYWRARALDLHLQPIGVFSKSEPIYIDSSLPMPQAPLLNTFDQMPDFQQPIYPVYQWIPLHDIMHYEVELMTAPPAEEHGTQPDKGRVWSRIVDSANTCYDEYARPYAGEYYWRVRALDANNNIIGTWSDTAKFTMPQRDKRVQTAVLGDSITHGGGAISYSPASLEYSYTTYLDFPCLNLGRSGDTSTTTKERFDTDVLPLHPLNLLVLTGSNSLRAPEISPQDIINDLEEIKRKCRSHDIRPIFMTLMPINPGNIKYAFHTDTDPQWRMKLTQVNSWIRQQDYYIDLEPYFYDAAGQQMDTGFAIDGLHPDIRGKMLMGEIINMNKKLFR